MTRHALPTAWDGHPVSWGTWVASTVFMCNRSKGTVDLACEECGHPGDHRLSIRGVLQDAQRLSLVLTRCTQCGADTVVDWRFEVWELDASDYGPEGSVAPQQTAVQGVLFDDVQQSRCASCGRECLDLASTDRGTWSCANDDLCARRAARQRRVTESPEGEV